MTASLAHQVEEGRVVVGPGARANGGGPGAVPGLTPLPQHGSLSRLQGVLKLAHSKDVADQQQAAMELASMCEGNVFPAVSFGPIAHALCRLLPSGNRTVAFYAARAVKTLLLDMALRGQAVQVGVAGVLVDALKTWREEVPCLREILGGLQTLCWDKATVPFVVNPSASGAGGIRPRGVKGKGKGTDGDGDGEDGGTASAAAVIPSAEASAVAVAVEEARESEDEEDPPTAILSLLEARDGEVLALATATVANLCAHADTALIADQGFLRAMSGQGLPSLLRIVQSRDGKLLRCYAMAALANAAANPVLAGRIKELDGVATIERVEKENERENSLTFGGSPTRISECAEAALVRLGARQPERGDAAAAAGTAAAAAAASAAAAAAVAGRKWRFKYGDAPVMELALDSGKNRWGVLGCLALWIVGFLLFLRPALQGGGPLPSV